MQATSAGVDLKKRKEAQPPARKMSLRARREAVFGYLFIMPWLLGC